ncbi:MAG: hypothetical protein AB7I50_15965 [Vicinamibacterales bacterium]
MTSVSGSDGTAVFTIWAHDIREIEGRFFAWWDHGHSKAETGEGMPKTQRGHVRNFVRLAAQNLGKPCRAVIVHRKPGSWEVASADYPHPRWARADFRCADRDALQFIVELLPPEAA